jgi:RimJ/RimL family protein N-acetyltransferase
LTRLIEASDADFVALLAGQSPGTHPVAEGGIESNEVLQMLQNLASAVRQDFSPAAWLIIDDGNIVGMCSLLSAPTVDGSVSIGYGIAPAYRGKGIGKRAIAELVGWAKTRPEIRAITAETAIANGPSQGILIQNGFAKAGDRVDAEDGTLFCWVHILTGRAAG